MHEVYHHAADPERETLKRQDQDLLSSSCGIGNTPSPASSSDQQDWNVEVHEHSTAEIKAITLCCQTNLAFLREKIGGHHYSQASYLQLVELLVAVGGALSLGTMNVLSDVLVPCNCYFIRRMRYLLYQSPHEMCFAPGDISTLINQSLEVLKVSISTNHVDLPNTPAFQGSQTILEYIFNSFIKDMSEDLSCQSLLEKAMSFTSKWSWFTKMFDLAFSLLELKCKDEYTINECLDILLGLALLPLRMCNSRIEQEELSTTLAKQLSQRIKALSDPFRKHFVILRIPSEHIRLKVIDLHLDDCFGTSGTTTTTTTTGTDRTQASQHFTLSKFKAVHLQKTVVGTKHDLGFFLSLLTLLLQSHVLLVSGMPILNFIPDRQDITCEANLTSTIELSDLNQPVMVFINRLSTDPVTASCLAIPTNWYYLELLITLTS